ncbi:STM3941 family protein [Chryseobacterium indologenes]|uniref:Uncharacterized protein n=1 Tax=Chryseobacterium indologenes TaxID=253 RepID=A0A0N1KSN1_CHRID|nr:STM3941 family protein [Chryseobacterium indologenes]KPE51059.1 hypothetical protein AOB46_10295 [Chryseobacterium indologenes]
MNKIEIKGSKAKLVIMFIGALIFVIVGVFLIINPETFFSVIFKNIIFIRVIGIVSIIFFGLCFIFLLRMLLMKENNLILDKNGITDNSSYSSVGMIDWKDITSIKSIDVMSTKFLIINLKDPNKYLISQNSIKRKLLERTFKTYGTPIAISSNALKCSFKELEQTILQFYNKYRYN